MATTTYYLSPISVIIQYFTNLGIIAPGALINTYVGGSVNTPVTTYTDSTGTVANPNPMSANSAGRPAGGSGAPVEFWAPSGTLLKLVVTDATGANQLVYLDNLPGINDISAQSNTLQALLASPASSNVAAFGPVAGVDLVANAVKSYDVIADLRAANIPVLASGQTLNIELQGGTAINDNLGGFFYWSPTAVGSDDGRLVIKPSLLANASPGRWLRYLPLGTPQIAVKTSAQQVASSTVLALDSQLFLNLPSAGTYWIQIRLQLLGIGGTGQGWKAGIAYSGTVLGDGAGSGVVTGNGAASVAATYDTIGSAGMSAAAVSSTGGDAVTMDYMVQVSTPGVIQVKFAQNSSSANATQMNPGSALIATRLA